MEERNLRKVMIGTVTSDKMDKTVVVSVVTSEMNKTYGKIQKRTYKLKAHDENNECQIGDKVRIVTKTHEYIYTVTSTETVDPSRTDVLKGGTKREITMITCTQAATKRIVVKGELTSERELDEQEQEEGVI